jgi:hypothetical protein
LLQISFSDRKIPSSRFPPSQIKSSDRRVPERGDSGKRFSERGNSCKPFSQRREPERRVFERRQPRGGRGFFRQNRNRNFKDSEKWQQNLFPPNDGDFLTALEEYKKIQDQLIRTPPRHFGRDNWRDENRVGSSNSRRELSSSANTTDQQRSHENRPSERHIYSSRKRPKLHDKSTEDVYKRAKSSSTSEPLPNAEQVEINTGSEATEVTNNAAMENQVEEAADTSNMSDPEQAIFINEPDETGLNNEPEETGPNNESEETGLKNESEETEPEILDVYQDIIPAEPSSAEIQVQ